MSAQNSWHRKLQPECSYSKKEHSQRVETNWTVTFDWWWSLVPLISPLLQRLQPKWFAQLPELIYMWNAYFTHGLIIIKCKNAGFAVIFLFWDGKGSIWFWYVFTKNLEKILVLWLFLSLWWKKVCLWLFTTLSFTEQFFPSGALNPNLGVYFRGSLWGAGRGE